jgi:hypothetical protein
MAHNAPIPDIRPLTDHERALLEWLLQHGTPEAKTYLPQLPHITVVSRCPCGCPTINLAVNGQISSAPIESSTRILADFSATSPEGIPIGLLVFSRADLLDTLELYSCTDESHFTLPCLADIQPNARSITP